MILWAVLYAINVNCSFMPWNQNTMNNNNYGYGNQNTFVDPDDSDPIHHEHHHYHHQLSDASVKPVVPLDIPPPMYMQRQNHDFLSAPYGVQLNKTTKEEDDDDSGSSDKTNPVEDLNKRLEALNKTGNDPEGVLKSVKKLCRDFAKYMSPTDKSRIDGLLGLAERMVGSASSGDDSNNLKQAHRPVPPLEPVKEQYTVPRVSVTDRPQQVLSYPQPNPHYNQPYPVYRQPWMARPYGYPMPSYNRIGPYSKLSDLDTDDDDYDDDQDGAKGKKKKDKKSKDKKKDKKKNKDKDKKDKEKKKKGGFLKKAVKKIKKIKEKVKGKLRGKDKKRHSYNTQAAEAMLQALAYSLPSIDRVAERILREDCRPGDLECLEGAFRRAKRLIKTDNEDSELMDKQRVGLVVLAVYATAGQRTKRARVLLERIIPKRYLNELWTMASVLRAAVKSPDPLGPDDPVDPFDLRANRFKLSRGMDHVRAQMKLLNTAIKDDTAAGIVKGMRHGMSDKWEVSDESDESIQDLVGNIVGATINWNTEDPLDGGVAAIEDFIEAFQ